MFICTIHMEIGHLSCEDIVVCFGYTQIMQNRKTVKGNFPGYSGDLWMHELLRDTFVARGELNQMAQCRSDCLDVLIVTLSFPKMKSCLAEPLRRRPQKSCAATALSAHGFRSSLLKCSLSFYSASSAYDKSLRTWLFGLEGRPQFQCHGCEKGSFYFA